MSTSETSPSDSKEGVKASSTASSADSPAANAERQTPSTSKHDAAGPPPRRHQRNGAGIVATIALIAALIALLGAGMLGWSWYQSRGQQNRIPQLAGRVSTLSGQVAALGSNKANVQSMNALSEQLHDVNRSLQARLKTVSEKLGEMTSRLSGASDAYRVDQAIALMRFAQVRLNLAHDPEGAAQALQLADEVLTDAHNASLESIHIALQREIAALEAVPKVDVGGLYVRIEHIADSVPGLPLAGAVISHPPAPATQSSGFSWSDVGAAFKRAFSSLIVIRHGSVAQPLLPPKQVWFVRQNLQLALASAQLALMEHNPAAWQASLGRAMQWLDRWFLTSDADVQNALKTLHALAAIDIAPKLPTLGSALSQLSAMRTHPPAATAAPSPATQ